jgi:hypothetical protein
LAEKPVRARYRRDARFRQAIQKGREFGDDFGHHCFEVVAGKVERISGL